MDDQQQNSLTGETYIAETIAPNAITFRYIDQYENFQFQDAVLRRAINFDFSIYREMLADETIFTAINQLKTTLVSKEWAVEAGGKDNASIQAADWLREELSRIGWDNITRMMVDAAFWGFKVAKLTFGLRDGKWSLTAAPYETKVDGLVSTVEPGIQVLPVELFRFSAKTKQLLGLTEQHPQEGEPLEQHRFWVVQANPVDHWTPYGVSMAEALYWLWWFKRHNVKFWIQFLDKFATPTVVVQYPPGTTKPDVQELITAAQAIHNESVVGIPSTAQLSLLESARSAVADFDRFQKSVSEAIRMVILGQTMTSTDGSSRSQAEVHLNVRDEHLQGLADLVDESFNRSVVKNLIRWNFGENVALPRTFRKIKGDPDMTPKAQIIKTMSEAGWEPAEELIRSEFGEGWSKKQDQPIRPPMASAQLPAFAEPGSIANAILQNRIDHDAIAGYAQQVALQYAELFGPTHDRIDDLLRASSSYEDARSALDGLISQPPNKTLVERLRDGLMTAHLAGRVKAHRE